MPKKQFHQVDHLINSYPSLILDKIIIHRQPTTEMKYLKATDRNNLFKETNFVKTVTFPLSTSHPCRYVFPGSPYLSFPFWFIPFYYINHSHPTCNSS